MRLKTVIQLCLIFFVIISLSVFFKKYFYKNLKKLDKTNDVNISDVVNSTSRDSSSSFIENINYISTDNNGNKYQITARLAEIDKDLSDVMFLEGVIAYIYSKDSDVVKITSDFGKYHTLNYDTIFSIDVVVSYTHQIATGEYLDFSFNNNIATMSDNVVYINGETELKADMLEIDIKTKDTKIFMNEINKKVIISGTK